MIPYKEQQRETRIERSLKKFDRNPNVFKRIINRIYSLGLDFFYLMVDWRWRWKRKSGGDGR